MRIVFSRKGFDSASGGGPSPIIDGRPVSLPIPSGGHSRTSWADLGLGDYVEHASRGRHKAGDLCHHDPIFTDRGECLLGQCGAAQTHLANRGVGVGDWFVFFGLFQTAGEPPHHRIFGYLHVAEIFDLTDCAAAVRQELTALDHPHVIGLHARNDTIYRGPGKVATAASPELRLTVPEGPPSIWRRPEWLRKGELSYHDRADRWLPENRLQTVARGQEFVAEVGDRIDPRKWLNSIVAAIESH